jgi:hypothetical protein
MGGTIGLSLAQRAGGRGRAHTLLALLWATVMMWASAPTLLRKPRQKYYFCLLLACSWPVSVCMPVPMLRARLTYPTAVKCPPSFAVTCESAVMRDAMLSMFAPDVVQQVYRTLKLVIPLATGVLMRTCRKTMRSDESFFGCPGNLRPL